MDKILKEACQQTLDNVPPIRQFLYTKSALLFQSLKNETNVNFMAEQYINLLEEYRDLLEQSYDSDAKNERNFTFEIRSIFKLCRILYFSKTYDNAQLLQWQAETFHPLLWQHDRHGIYTHLLNHPDFWPFAYRLVLFGQIETLLDLFSRLPSEDDWVPTLLSFIKKESKQEPLVDNPAHTLCLLLRGDQETVAKYAVHPVQCLLMDRLQGKLNPLTGGEGVLESLFSGNIHQALSYCKHYDPWLLAHLTILFDHRLDPIVLGDTRMPSKEYFVLIYATRLERWQDVFEYLLSCKTIGIQAIKEYLKTIEFDEQVVDFCRNNDMKQEGLELYERRANTFLDLKNYKEAYVYYSLAENTVHLDNILKQVILDYINTGVLVDIDTKPSKHSKLYNDLKTIQHNINQLDYTTASINYQNLIQSSLPDWVLFFIFEQGVQLLEKTKLDKSVLLYLKKLWKELQQERDSDVFDTSSILISRALVQ